MGPTSCWTTEVRVIVPEGILYLIRESHTRILLNHPISLDVLVSPVPVLTITVGGSAPFLDSVKTKSTPRSKCEPGGGFRLGQRSVSRPSGPHCDSSLR